MIFNFKNNNLLIILLLVLLITSCLCYNIIQNDVENYKNLTQLRTNMNNPESDKYFKEIQNNADTYYSYFTLRNHYIFDNSLSYFSNKSDDLSNIGLLDSFISKFDDNTDYSYNMIQYGKTGVTGMKFKNKNNLSDNQYTLKERDSRLEDISYVNFLFLTKKDKTDGQIYDLSKEKLNYSISIDNINIIYKGKIITKEQTAKTTTTATTGRVTGGAASIGDIIIGNGQPGYNLGLLGLSSESDILTSDLLYYMQQQKLYNSPYYGSFENVMSSPSNPIYNSLNNMNPLEYSNTLFPNTTTPMMQQNAYMNSNVNNEEEKDLKKRANGIDIDTSYNVFKEVNKKANLLSQNYGSQNSGNNTPYNNNNSEVPPCPPCERCPESNFDCKKVPSYEQGYDNKFLPRPVLTNFSTFGM